MHCCAAPPWGVPNPKPSLAWTPPPGWPTPPQGWSPPLGWQPDPDWQAVPPGHQWWQPTQRGVRRRRTVIALVGLSTAAGLLFGIYRIALRTIQDHALHQQIRHGGSGWYPSPSIAVGETLSLIWLCSIVLLIPASSIGASELFGAGRGRRTRAAAFVAWLCIGVVCQYTAGLLAAESRGSLFAPDAWLHDGRSWWALMCLLSIVMFAGVFRLLKPARMRPSAA
jgi:hypothetical protein